MKKILTLMGLLVVSGNHVQSSNALNICPSLEGQTLNGLGWNKFKKAGAEWEIFQHNNDYNNPIGKKTSESIEGGYVYCAYQKPIGVSVTIRSNNHPALKRLTKQLTMQDQNIYRDRVHKVIYKHAGSKEVNIKPSGLAEQDTYRARRGGNSSGGSSSSWE